MASYATPEELRLQTQGAGDAAALQPILDAASEAIDHVCNRPDGFVALASPAARLYPGSGKSYQWLDECVQITLVEVKDSPTDGSFTAWTSGDWQPFSGDPQRPNFNRTPYMGILLAAGSAYGGFTSGRQSGLKGFRPDPDARMERAVPTVRVTARWGYADTVPAVVKQACLTQAARWWKRGQSAWADASASAEGGMLLYRKVLDPDVELMLIRGRLIRQSG